MIISGSAGTRFSSMISDSHVGHGQRQLWNWVLVMISSSAGTQFSSMISDSDVGHGAEDFRVTPGTGFR